MDRHSREGPGSYGYIVIKMDKRKREREISEKRNKSASNSKEIYHDHATIEQFS